MKQFSGYTKGAASVRVQVLPGLTDAAIYSNTPGNAGGVALPNPLTADPDGFYSFCADDGSYQITCSGGKLAAPVVTTVTLSDAAGRLAQAQAMLDASDITMIRCVEHGLAVPAEWSTYRTALRAVVAAGGASALPSKPSYPAGS